MKLRSYKASGEFRVDGLVLHKDILNVLISSLFAPSTKIFVDILVFVSQRFHLLLKILF